MSSNAIVFEGSKLEIGATAGDPGTDTFTEIGEITDFDGPAMDTTMIDVSHNASSVQEDKAGLPSYTFTASFNGIPDNAGQQQARTDADNRDRRNFKVTLADGHEINFEALISSFTPVTGSVDQRLEGSISLKIQTQPAYTAPA